MQPQDQSAGTRSDQCGSPEEEGKKEGVKNTSIATVAVLPIYQSWTGNEVVKPLRQDGIFAV